MIPVGAAGFGLTELGLTGFGLTGFGLTSIPCIVRRGHFPIRTIIG